MRLQILIPQSFFTSLGVALIALLLVAYADGLLLIGSLALFLAGIAVIGLAIVAIIFNVILAGFRTGLAPALKRGITWSRKALSITGTLYLLSNLLFAAVYIGEIPRRLAAYTVERSMFNALATCVLLLMLLVSIFLPRDRRAGFRANALALGGVAFCAEASHLWLSGRLF